MLSYAERFEGCSNRARVPDAAMSHRSDRELVEAARRGDKEAFGALVRLYQRRVYRLTLHLLRSHAEAEDVTQETFVRAYRALHRFDGRSEPFTWIYRIAVNLSLNTIRARRPRWNQTTPDDPQIEEQLAEEHPKTSNPHGASEDRQLAAALSSGIDALSHVLRTTLILVAVDGLSHAAASEVLGCTEGTVAWRVHEARRKLRNYLAERGHGDGHGG